MIFISYKKIIEREKVTTPPHINGLLSKLRKAKWKLISTKPLIGRSPSGERVVFMGAGEHGVIPLHTSDRHVAGLLAQALLEAAAVAHSLDATPVAVVILKRVSPINHDRVERFVERVAADRGWILADEEGRFFPHIPGDTTLRQINVESQSSPASSGPTRINLFTDLNQWMSKVLLAPQLPEKLLNAPRAPIRNATLLADVARVSIPVAARFVRALDVEGFLDTSHGDLRIANPARFLNTWVSSLNSARLHPYRRDVSARFVRGPSSNEFAATVLRQHATLEDVPSLHPGSAPEFWMMGGLFTACDALELGHVVGTPPTIVVPSLDRDVLKIRGIVLDAHAAEASFLLRVSTYPESVRRGSVVASGMRVTDVIQCWLDASLYHLRGEEQASFIWRRALGPAFGRSDE